MPRKLRRPKTRVEPCPVGLRHFLLHGDSGAALAADPAISAFDLLLLDRQDWGPLWAEQSEELLPAWIQQRPGTRPWAWWKFDAPAWTEDIPPRAFDLAVTHRDVWNLKQPRRRLGGRGTEAYAALNVVPAFRYGLPTAFVTQWDVSYYNGRARSVTGERIGVEHPEGHFPHQGYDPDDPPVFESEASYLRRYDLLTPGEARRLPADAFAPERIEG